MSRRRALTKQEILEAINLREEGWTKRKLARRYEVGETTIWENIFMLGKITRTLSKTYTPAPSFRKIRSVVDMILKMRSYNMTSLEISGILQMSLEEVNFIFSHNPHAIHENRQELI